MAIIDLPQTRGFLAASFTLGLDVNESGFRGFYTGNQQTQSTLSDRLTGILTLPPTTDAVAAAAREALLLALVSARDHLRLPPQQRRAPLGTISGAVTVGANALAGARSITLAGAKARPNLLLNSGFEIDTNADGLADGWAQYVNGTTGAITASRVAGNGSDWAQRIVAAGLGSATPDQAGVRYAADYDVTAGLAYTLSADTRDNGPAIRLNIDWYNVSAAYLSSSTSLAVSSGSAWARRTLAATAPAGAVVARLYAWMEAMPGGPAAAAIEIDNVQFEQAIAATTYAGGPTLLAGDIISAGGNLLHVGFAGAVGNDAGAITVPLSLPLPKAVTAGAAVSLAPTGLWEWDADAPQFDYSPGRVQGPISIPLRQVIA